MSSTTKTRRTQYTEMQKNIVRTRYSLCRTIEDKRLLAEEAGVGTVHRLYNLASRLGVTRTSDTTALQPSEGEVALELVFTDRERFRLREDFRTTVFSDSEDDFLRRNFGSQGIERISYHLNHTVSATLYRARHLGLRRPPRYWDAQHVSDWLNISEDGWGPLTDAGVIRHQLTDRSGNVKMTVIASIALARWLVDGERWRSLLDAGADEFFCRDILESVADLQQRRSGWEACAHLSAGHTCTNSFGISYGLFCSDSDRFSAGCDPKCSVKLLRPEDLKVDR